MSAQSSIQTPTQTLQIPLQVPVVYVEKVIRGEDALPVSDLEETDLKNALVIMTFWQTFADDVLGYQKYEVIYGRAAIIELPLDRVGFELPADYKNVRIVVIIPRWAPTIVRVEQFFKGVIHKEVLYIFTEIETESGVVKRMWVSVVSYQYRPKERNDEE